MAGTQPPESLLCLRRSVPPDPKVCLTLREIASAKVKPGNRLKVTTDDLLRGQIEVVLTQRGKTVLSGRSEPFPSLLRTALCGGLGLKVVNSKGKQAVLWVYLDDP